MSCEVDKPSPPVLCGYLTKLKHKRSVFGSWTKRYFEVNESRERIEYFRTKPQCVDDATPSGFINLSEVDAVRKYEGNAFQIEAGPYVLFLKTGSAAEHACWVQGLQNYVEQRREYDRMASAREVSMQETACSDDNALNY